MPAQTAPPAHRRPPRLRPPLVLLALGLAALVAACGVATVPSPQPASPTPALPTPTVAAPPTPVLAGDGLLVSYRAHGGHCRTGECEFNAAIHADGRVDRSDGMEQVVDPMSLGLLVEGIEAADWDAILAVPFTGECPVNFDGQEVIYTFHVDPEPIQIASCTTEVDTGQEPFRTIDGILFGTGG